MTVRTLETLIRISTAHAKLRLSPSVAGTDVEVALRLLNYAIFDIDDDGEGIGSDEEMLEEGVKAMSAPEEHMAAPPRRRGRTAKSTKQEKEEV